MTPPFRPSPTSAVPPHRGCVGDHCASGRDAWPLHQVRHDGVFCRLCSSCVLLYHPSAFCSACLHLLSPTNPNPAARPDPAFAPPGPTAPCSGCGLAVAHLSCVPDPASFLCAPCAAAEEGRPFSYAPAGRRVLDERAARVLLIAARLAHESVARAAAAARAEADRCVAEAAAARKRSREMLDAAFRALEEEAKQAKIAKLAKPAPAPPAPPPPPPKKKTPKSSEANRDRDKMLKFNAMQQPALAFAAVAAAAASSMPSREDKKQTKHDTQGSVDAPADGEPKVLFGTLQS
ncbi:uncharacterized abhydrolase domain-containing protein DDB_G0269086 [Brachypodium distachyon]|uniref:Uncharacterized protein n=1 Tax=Brachypodium distachyon TaxID=15368 RepID=I1HM72_BRADI|nr:uncharacterized abhydrolase domain-containing protein DDB_G0269086 [Brachypodium distachyon]KQK07677.1 hypothetical protein BRADI_2g36960v3 [Brachypodium distachyon]|eukprot:XP_010231753.1 uncharacterized abhydrolase domain-containing protein DDB_G0269086 [Brachypodium distachyon]